MNKSQFRLVFNRVRGMLVAVEETATATGKSSRGESVCSSSGRVQQILSRFALRHAAFAVLVAAGATPVWVDAQVVGAGAHAPSVIQTQNGLQQVNITKPSGAGVSLNTFSQFDVPKAGVVVNNSPTLTNTQLAGYINGNPNFGANDAAKIIINQVSSSNPSQLKGYVEIAGKRAEMVISNPSGIVVDGGGFINTSRAILTTGAPTLNADGSLAGFNTTRGLITVQGAGLNATNVDEVDLIARAVQANAAIYANNLNVIAGANQVNHDTLAATPIQGDGAAPAVAIDVAQLGGMYSNRILLVGTEGGVGVRNVGTIAADAMGLTLTTDGRLVQSGKISSLGNVAVSAAGGIENSGTTYGQQSVSLNTGADVVNTGTVAAQHNVGVTAGSLNSTGLLGAGVDSNGTVTQAGDLQVTTTGQLNATGKNVAGGNVSATGYGVNLAGGTTAANGNLSLTATGGDVNLTNATTSALGVVTANAAGTVINDHGNLTSGGSTTLTGGNVSNQSGNVSSQGPLSVTAAGQIANQAGLLVSQSATALRGSTVANNQGTIQSAGHATVDGITIDNTAGRITSLGTDGLVLTAAGQLTNAAGTTADGAQGGVIGSNGDVTVQGGAVANHATITSNSNLHVSGQSVDNSGGTLKASQKVTVDAGARLVNSGGTVVGQTAALTGTTLDNSAGTVEADQVSLTATNVVNHAGTITQNGAGAMTVDVSATLDNSSGGMLQTNSTDLTLAPASLVNDGGTITHAGAGTLTLGNGSGSVSNVGGSITSNGRVAAQAGSLNNTSGSIDAQTGLTATVGGTLNNTNGKLLSNTNLGMTSGTLTNDGGQIGASTNASIQVGSMTNQGGSIVAPNLSVTANSTLDNSGGKLEANQLSLTTPTLTNHGGVITQYGSSAMGVNVSNTLDNSAGGVIQTNSTDLTLAPAQLNNAGGTITHAGTGTLTIDPGNGASALNNASGTIVTKGQAVVDASSWDNSGGILAAQGGVTATIAGNVNNSQGLVRAGSSLSLTNGGALVNQAGHIQAGQQTAGDMSTLAVQSGSINNADGSITDLGTGKMTVQGGSQITNSHSGNVQGMGAITGNGDVTVSAASISNTQGGQLSGASLHVQGTTLDNSGGQIGNVTNSSGNVDVTTSGAVTNTGGQISSTHDLTVTAATLQGGGMYSATHDANVNLQGDFSVTPDYQFNVGHDLAFTLPGTFANIANLQSVNGLSVNASNVVNSGAMSAGGLLHSQSTNLTNTGAIVGGSVSLNATGTVSNLGPTALIGASDSNGTLEILAKDIENRDDTTATDTMPTTAIFGMGKVVLAGGKDASGNYTNASLINNVSALIQSGGDMELHADKVTSTRRVMSTSGSTSNVDPAALAQYGISLSGCASYFAVNCAGGGQMIAGLGPSNLTPAITAALIAQPGGMYVDPPHGGQWNSGYFYTTYTGTAVGNTVTALSPTAQIVSGGSLNATSTGTLQNYWSSITAVGNLNLPQNYDGNGWAATGQQAPTVTVTYSGQYHYNNYDSSEYNWQLPFGNAPFVTGRPGGYTQVAPADVKTYRLPAYDSTLGSNGTISGTGVSINNTAANASIPSLGLLPGQAVPGLTIGGLSGSASGTKSGASAVHGGGVTTVNPIIASATALNVLNNLTIPQGGLFKPNPSPSAAYVIETNPAFTNQKNFISSDYFFGQIGVDLTHIPKRLGDGFYEQQLVRNQVTALTGRAVLGPYADLQAMYQSLMAAGASLEKSLNLPLGASLSAEQVSQLTSNVIMMETRAVDGQSVLVPVVYLAKASQQDFNGPLITAKDIDFQNAQSFTNSGTLKADNTLSIQGKQIDNAFGSLQSGGLTTLTAEGNVDLTSAKVKAGSLLIGAGGDLILDTATKTTKQVSRDGATRVTTTLGPTASIDVAGDAGIITGGNFQQNAGSLSIGGNFGALIGGDWNLGAVQTGEHQVVQRANGVSDTDFNQSVVSSVKVGGVSGVAIAGDLTSHGAQIELGKGGAIAAQGNVSLLTASATSIVNSNSSGSDSHGSYAETLHASNQTLTGTTLKSGDALSISSGKDITLSGSALVLDKGKATLEAKGDVNVGVATETREFNSHENHSHSSVVSSTKVASDLDQTDTISHGSLVSADSVSVTSGRDINVTGSAVVGTGDVSLDAARHVNILAAEDRSDSAAYYDKKQSGLMGSGGLGFTVGSAEQKAQSDNHSVTQSQDRSTVGSVQGNVSIKAGENVHIGGSDITAGKAADDTKNATGNIKITGQNVTIDPSQDDTRTHDQQETKSSGLTVAVTGTPLDTVRNLKDNASNGNGFQRGQSVANEIGAGALDVPSVSVTYGSSKSKSVNDTSSQTHAGSAIRGAGNVSVVATGGAERDAQGNVIDGDISVIGSSISAGGKTLLDANRNVTLAASTDQYQQSTQTSSSSTSIALASSPSLGDLGRWIGGTANHGGNSPSPYNASRANSDGNLSETHQTASLVTGDSVTIHSRTGDVNVVGSGVSGTNGVKVTADQGAVNILAGLETSTSHQESSSRTIGSLGSNGTSTGFSVGVANSHTVQDSASQTQNTMRSQIASASGNVTIEAKKDVTIAGTDLLAGNDVKLKGENVHLDPGSDTTQTSMSQHSSQFGVSLALGGAVGNAVAAVNQSMRNPARGGDARLGALDKAQAALSVYDAVKVAENFSSGNPTAQPLVKATVSIGGGSSSSESHSNSLANSGSTITAGRNVEVIATGSGAKDGDGFAADGDIDGRGTRITGKSVTLDAARDVNLQSAKDTTQLSSSNSSSGGSIGIGANFGGQQNGFTLELGASVAHGNANGQSVTNRDTVVSASDTLTVKSGRDTNLRGAEATGNRVVADVGRDLNIQSQQDTATYESKQTSGGFQASICVPPVCYGQTVSGSGNISQENIKATYSSVNTQSGIFAGSGGYDVNVGNHTQLDGGAIAATASEDKNSLSTQTFGYTNIENKASYSGEAVGFSASGGVGNSSTEGINWNTPITQSGPVGPGPVTSNGLGPSGFSSAGTSSDVTGTTYATVSPGKITVRGDAGTGQDSTAALNRDMLIANGAVQNTFDAQKVENDIAVQQAAGQVGMQVVGAVGKYMTDKAAAAVKTADDALKAAERSGDPVAIATAKANLDSANQQYAMWNEDSASRTAAHAIVAGGAAALGGGNVAGAVGGTLAGDYVGKEVGQLTNDTLGGTLLGNVAAGAAGAAAGGAIGGASGALSGAGGALSADLYNRQLHPDEKKLAEQLAAKAKSQGIKNADGSAVTSTDIANQLAQMGYRANGVSESGAAATVEGAQPNDGSTWVKAGVDQNTGKTVWTQVPGAANQALQSFILQNTNGADVPLVQQYSPSSKGASGGGSSSTITGPFTRLPNQADLGYIKSTTSDLASATSTTAGWVGATTGALAAAPTPLAPAFAGISYATTVVGVSADAVGQVLNPNVGQYWVGGGVNVLSNYVSGKYPMLGPVVNAIGNTFNNDDYVGKMQNAISSYWQAVVNSISTSGGGKGAKN
ncbi:hemagglutinin repeat-containing protein [Burkholderia vietnamiensis]|uniref:hemagglutinin repeat-containing protein n=1 Tax=Burkholderia vietnamiensis TaxID=60552 RepID=UPI00201866D0|nr:hemagglutinin repeat-containing protein [Burkholderia vietnamiensis]MCO1351227.1 hemagglutinin repeat-containing protein [Burkholderia vietnamiensis]MCO1433569.1 hemagglutinin repeat-containing protein [Burkholderia vietnamiensis]UQN49055.1 hemagglutinin repeat-containing protein [Burkholderia vietnamiensis]HDR9021946.1 hemagglutinin repeat-containing protein [Burkholderia vietnamiensis]